MKHMTLVLVGLLLTAPGVHAEPPITTVAAGRAPTMDGTVTAEEWADATTVPLGPEGEGFLLRDEEALYVGLRVGRACTASLALLCERRVLVLHASASLGTAEYVPSGDAWTATRTFAWRCRDGRTSNDDRARFFAEEDWIATTTGDGRPGEVEYRISRRLLAGEHPRMSLVACRLQPSPPLACSWPAAANDGTRDQDLLFGNTPDVRFDPDDWACLALGPAGTPEERFDLALDEIEREPDPLRAYQALLDLLEDREDAGRVDDRAQRLRKSLEGRKRVAPEARAQRKLEAALRVARTQLRDVQEKHPGTRAARIAEERLQALER